MTHLHFDHASGMSEFGGAQFVLRSASGRPRPPGRGRSCTATGRAQFDYAFDYRTIDFDGPTVDSYSTFGRTFDLFGDGSVRLAYTPGHSAGHQSVICRLSDRDLVIAGDAIYTLAQLDDAPPPPRPEDPHTWRRSLQELQLFQPPVPAGRDHPGPRPEDLARAQEALRVGARRRAVGGLAALGLEGGVHRLHPVEDLARSLQLLLAAGAATRGKVTGSPYWTVTLGNRRRFQRRTPSEP